MTWTQTRLLVVTIIALSISGCGTNKAVLGPDTPITESLPISNDETNNTGGATGGDDTNGDDDTDVSEDVNVDDGTNDDIPIVPGNLLHNTGFEELQPNQEDGESNEIVYWTTSGDVTLDADEVNSGEYSVRVEAEDSTSRISSALLDVTPHSRIEFSGMLKAQDVVSPGSYYQLRITLSAYTADRETKIRHWDLVSTIGSFDWQLIQSAIIVPGTARYMRLDLSLTNCTGTFWADDLSIREIQLPPQQQADKSQPDASPSEMTLQNLVPTPWQVVQTDETHSIHSIAILPPTNDATEPSRLLSALQSYLDAMSIEYEILPTDFAEQAAIAYVRDHSAIDTLLLIRDEKSEKVTNLLSRVDPNLAWTEMGAEGYFLSIDHLDADSEEKAMVLLGANSEAGHFYGLQTIKQLLDESNNTPGVAIVDRPTLSRRGTPVGIQWYRESERLMERLASLKFNFVWNQGTFEDQIFWYRWREPMSDSTKESIRAYLDLAERNFITPFISIGPRGEDPSSATIYSSEEDIEAVVRKMEQLYEIGVRHFGLSFDDLNNDDQNVLLGNDIEEFENIGEAHTYFTDQVFRRLRAEHDDIEMMIVPMVYNGIGYVSDVDQAYLAAISQLPAEIGLYSSIAYQQDADAALALTARSHFVWDNYWASFYSPENPAPEAIVPLDRSLREDTIIGYSFMPIVPDAEDSSLFSWQSAANFAWAPSRYIASETVSEYSPK